MLAGHGVTAVGKAAPGQQRPRDHRELVRFAGQPRPQGGEGNVQRDGGDWDEPGERRMCDDVICFRCSGS